MAALPSQLRKFIYMVPRLRDHNRQHWYDQRSVACASALDQPLQADVTRKCCPVGFRTKDSNLRVSFLQPSVPGT